VKNKEFILTITIVCFVLGLMLTMQLKTVKVNSEASSARTSELQTQFAELKKNYDAKVLEVEEKDKMLEEYRKAETDEETVAPLEIFQNESGIQFVNLMRWFDIEEQEEVLEFISFDNIMHTIEEKYSGTIYTNPLTVESAKLYTFTLPGKDEEYTLVPVWVCRIAEKHVDWGEEVYTSYIYIPINAVTGEEMLVLEN